MNIKSKISILGAAFMLQSCATIFSGTSQTLHVEALDATTKERLEGCHCIVTDGAGGQQAVTSNPGTVRVSKSHGGVIVTCNKQGYRQLNTTVGDSFNGATIANVLFWPGFIVDAATGAYKKLPSHYVVSMEKIKP